MRFRPAHEVGQNANVAASGFTVELMHDRPRPDQELEALFAGGWPAFIDADLDAARSLPRIRKLFADLEVVVVEDRSDELVAACWGVPIQWDGRVIDLPAGYSGTLTRALIDHGPAQVNTLVLCGAQVRNGRTGAGLATELLRTMLIVATQHGLAHVVAPLRLTGKHRYPLTPIAQYAAWTRPDGTAFDPWLRTHLALGARVIASVDVSQEFVGSCAQWQQWAALAMPETGDYLVPDALAPLHLDRQADRGTLAEPGVWVQHR